MQKICPHCNKKFSPKRKNQTYCSTKCRDLAYKKRKYKREKEHKVVCVVCNKEFVTTDSRVKYCSVKCRNKVNREKLRRKDPDYFYKKVKEFYEKHPEKKKEVFYNPKRQLEKLQHFIEENDKTREISIKQGNYKTPYSKEEDEFLLQNWDKMKKKEIALHLGRTVASVQSRYRKLKKIISR